VQAKLEVGSAADTHEQEADRIATQVMHMPEPLAGRACACGGRCRSWQASQEPPGRGIMPAGEAAAPPAVGEVLRSPGQALDPATRAFMEPRLGRDFSTVRVHADGAAAASASSLNARAYTAGPHIVFASGEYEPRTAEGGRLLAHELAHVVQQSGGGAVVQRAPAPENPTQLEPAKSAPTLGAPARAGNSMSTLRAKSAEVQRRLQDFSGLKEWRLAFHASSDETFREISQLTRETSKLKTELREILDKWYFTLVENTRLTDTQRRLDDTMTRLGEEYWKLRWPSDAEKAYELQSQKVEAGLVHEQAAITAEIGRLDKAGTRPSQGPYESLLARLNKLSIAVDKMWDAEIQAQAKYTGSGPVSHAQ
jgi:hypothetical protein